jgi:hypothetical protein
MRTNQKQISRHHHLLASLLEVQTAAAAIWLHRTLPLLLVVLLLVVRQVLVHLATTTWLRYQVPLLHLVVQQTQQALPVAPQVSASRQLDHHHPLHTLLAALSAAAVAVHCQGPRHHLQQQQQQGD